MLRTLLTRIEMTKLEKAEAKKQIASMLEKCDAVIAFGFMLNGETMLVTVTDYEIYDKLGMAMAVQLQKLGKQVEEESKEEK